MLVSTPFTREWLLASMPATARGEKTGMGKAAKRGEAVGGLWGVPAALYVVRGHVQKYWEAMLGYQV